MNNGTSWLAFTPFVMRIHYIQSYMLMRFIIRKLRRLLLNKALFRDATNLKLWFTRDLYITLLSFLWVLVRKIWLSNLGVMLITRLLSYFNVAAGWVAEIYILKLLYGRFDIFFITLKIQGIAKLSTQCQNTRFGCGLKVMVLERLLLRNQVSLLAVVLFYILNVVDCQIKLQS